MNLVDTGHCPMGGSCQYVTEILGSDIGPCSK
jgi:hypothetical protein